MQVQVFDGVATAAAGDVMLVLWQSGAKAARIRWVNERALALIAKYPQGIAAAQFLLPSATPPGLGEVGEVRVALRAIAPHARRLIVVPLGSATWQSVVRGVMRAGLALLGQSERIKVAASASEALLLLDEMASGNSPARSDLDGALRMLFRALGDDATWPLS